MSKKKSKEKKYFIVIEDTQYEWNSSTITTEQIIELGGWDPSKGALLVDLKAGTERTLEPEEIIEIKPGMSFAKKVIFKRGSR